MKILLRMLAVSGMLLSGTNALAQAAADNGQTIEDRQRDTLDSIPNWALTREYRVTYRDSLTDSEKLIEGELQSLKENAKKFFLNTRMKISPAASFALQLFVAMLPANALMWLSIF